MSSLLYLGRRGQCGVVSRVGRGILGQEVHSYQPEENYVVYKTLFLNNLSFRVYLCKYDLLTSSTHTWPLYHYPNSRKTKIKSTPTS
jgi:hypothetical protein